MANPWAGEVELVLDGRRQRLKLTLGALAELEAELGTGTLVELVERFEGRRFSTRDVLALIVAGLRGGGWQGGAEDLRQADIEGVALGAARAASPGADSTMVAMAQTSAAAAALATAAAVVATRAAARFTAVAARAAACGRAWAAPHPAAAPSLVARATTGEFWA